MKYRVIRINEGLDFGCEEKTDDRTREKKESSIT